MLLTCLRTDTSCAPRVQERLGVTPKDRGAGTANTALVFHARRLLALHEGDLPYAGQWERHWSQADAVMHRQVTAGSTWQHWVW